MFRLLLLVFIFICYCSCSKKTSDPSAMPEDKDASELSATDIYNLVLVSEGGGGFDFEGELYGNEATDDISIYANGGCGNEDCGISLVMENKNPKKDVRAVIKAKFKLPSNKINEMTRVYQMTPGQAISIGCSHICHQNNSYMIQREIVSAGYVKLEDKKDVKQLNANKESPS